MFKQNGYLLAGLASVALSGCFGAPELDVSDQASMQASGQEIIKALPEKQQAAFGQAIHYFVMASKQADIDGLTGEEIIALHQAEQAEQERQKAQQLIVKTLSDEANELLLDDQFDAALAKYQALQENPLGADIAEQGIAKVEKAKADYSMRLAYVDKVKITEFDAKTIQFEPAFRMNIHNSGERNLSEVKAIVRFKDADENVLLEYDFYPVRSNEHYQKVLNAGYELTMNNFQYQGLGKPLPNWKSRNTDVKIVSVRFAD